MKPIYIDANYLLKEISFYADRPTKFAMETIKGLALMPNPDVIEVVRCKDCKFRKPTNLHPNEWFCPRRTMAMHEKDLDGYCDEGKRKEIKDEGDR